MKFDRVSLSLLWTVLGLAAPAAEGQILSGEAFPGSLGNQATIVVSNPTDRIVEAVRLDIVDRPLFLTSVTVEPSIAEVVEPGGSQRFLVRFDIDDEATVGDRGVLALEVSALDAEFDLPEPAVRIAIAEPPVAATDPSPGPTDRVLVLTERLFADHPDYRPGAGAGIVRLTGGEPSGSWRLDAPETIVPGEPLLFTADGVERQTWRPMTGAGATCPPGTNDPYCRALAEFQRAPLGSCVDFPTRHEYSTHVDLAVTTTSRGQSTARARVLGSKVGEATVRRCKDRNRRETEETIGGERTVHVGVGVRLELEPVDATVTTADAIYDHGGVVHQYRVRPGVEGSGVAGTRPSLAPGPDDALRLFWPDARAPDEAFADITLVVSGPGMTLVYRPSPAPAIALGDHQHPSELLTPDPPDPVVPPLPPTDASEPEVVRPDPPGGTTNTPTTAAEPTRTEDPTATVDDPQADDPWTDATVISSGDEGTPPADDPWTDAVVVSTTTAGPTTSTDPPAVAPEPTANPAPSVVGILTDATNAARSCRYVAALALARRAQAVAPGHPWLAANLPRLERLADRQRRATALLAEAERLLRAGRPRDSREKSLAAADVAPSCLSPQIADVINRTDAVLSPPGGRRPDPGAITAITQILTDAINAAMPPPPVRTPQSSSPTTAGGRPTSDPCRTPTAGNCLCPTYVKRGSVCVPRSEATPTGGPSPTGQSGSSSQPLTCSVVDRPWPTDECTIYTTGRGADGHTRWIVVERGTAAPRGFLSGHYYTGSCQGAARALQNVCPRENRP